MVSDITLSGQQASTQTSQNQRITLAEDFSQFLTLLTTQLQNQDPTDPLDTNQFTEQLVQFSQVEQQINANQKLDDLVALSINDGITNALSFVGLNASYISSELSYDGETASTIRYSLDSTAASSTINIFDQSRSLIFSGEGSTTQGTHEFTWDGTDLLGNQVPEGTYSISIDSLDAQDEPISTTTVVTGIVRGIEQQDGVVFALVGERAIPTASILNAQEIEAIESNEENNDPTT